MKLYQTALQNLQGAYALIKDKRHWTQGTLAIDCKGNDSNVKTKEAVAFCALGAVLQINGPGERAAIKILARAAVDILAAQGRHHEITYTDKKRTTPDEGNIIEVNDAGSVKSAHRDVLKMFRNAIKMAAKRA